MLKVLPLGLGQSYILRADAGEIILNAYESLRLRVRQRLQKRRVYHAKNRRCRSDTQGNRQNNCCREAGRLSQHAKAEAHILDQNVDKIPGDRFAAFFFTPLAASELDARATLGFLAVQ